ncbi:MAG: YerC/YecD family TrpR-related protein [Bacilli bacterium]
MLPKTKDKDDLFKVILSLENIDECYAFFEDLCTINEVESMSGRLQAAKMLMDGKTYEQVIEATDISSATLSRVSKCVHYGAGGYQKVYPKIKDVK